MIAKQLGAPICALAVMLSVAINVHAASSALRTNKELAATVEKLNALKVWLTDAEKQRALLQQDIQKADREVARLGLELAELQRAVAEIETQKSALAKKSTILEQQRQTEGRRISQHLNAAYRMSGQDFFKLLLNQENPEQLDRMIRYHQYFSTERGKILQGFRATLSAIETNRQEIEANALQLINQRKVTAAQQAVFTTELDERKQLIANLDRATRNKQAEQQRLEQDRVRLQSLLQELAKRAEKADGQEFATRRGQLPWPTAGTQKNVFGEPRADGRLRWQGNYIVTKPGEIIRSVHRGRVVFAEWLRGFGLLTIVDHGNGYMSLYGYADVLLKQPGDRVESGEQIANSGRSGGQNADGLYFEIRKDGKPVDPSRWLKQ